MTAVIDTSVLYALVDANDAQHARCLAAVQEEAELIVVPNPTLPEVCRLISTRMGPQREAAFVRYLSESDWRLEPLGNGDFARVASIMSEQIENQIGFVDAAVVAIAERMGATRIYTLDRRHFEPIRPQHADRFELLPAQ